MRWFGIYLHSPLPYSPHYESNVKVRLVFSYWFPKLKKKALFVIYCSLVGT